MREVIVPEVPVNGVLARQQAIDKTKTLLRTFALVTYVLDNSALQAK